MVNFLKKEQSKVKKVLIDNILKFDSGADMNVLIKALEDFLNKTKVEIN